MKFQVEIPNKNLDSKLFKKETGFDLYSISGQLYISGCSSQEEAENALLNHNPPLPKEPTIEEKLASVGLSLTDLKSALGLE